MTMLSRAGFGTGLLALACLAAPTLRLTPAQIEMNSFYSGAEVRIEGKVSAGADVVVVVRGADKEEVFNRKARFGPIWATAGKVRVSGVPSLFLCYSTRPVQDILNAGTIDHRLLHTDAIRRQMHIEPAQTGGSDSKIRSDYLTLKQEEGIYGLYPGGVKPGRPAQDETSYTVNLVWPKTAPPGVYRLKVLECRDGKVVSENSTDLEVVKVGFPSSLAALAETHAALYGAFAIFAAMIAGFGMDFLVARIFGKKRPTAH